MAGAVFMEPTLPRNGGAARPFTADLAYSIVVPTYERPGPLRKTLEGIAAQSRLPKVVIVVDSSPEETAREVVDSFADRLHVIYQLANEPSAAMQRNQGALRVTTPLVAFIDDDVLLFPDTCDIACSVFDRDFEGTTGGVGARPASAERSAPKGLLWWYYRLQAGYSHPTYGGKLFGAAVNCFPTYTETEGDLIPADWLNSGCVFYRTPIFHREMFPNFKGYSYMEDVHLSARIAKRSAIWFHTRAKFVEQDVTSYSKTDVREIARMRIRNQRLVCREILGLSGFELAGKSLLHRLFVTGAIIRRRDSDWLEELHGTWL